MTISSHEKSLSYRDAGVDISAGNLFVERIKPIARRTFRPEVLAGLGGFGALFELPLHRYRNPVLVSGTDGVGTKLKLAIQWAKHHTIGVDLVAMCVNDLLVQGAEPLFFLDYYATGKLDPVRAAQVIDGIALGCEQAGCSLIGGETAEMPGMYAGEDYDLAGFCVGIVEKDQLITGEYVGEGDMLLGLASSGPHSNGYSLIRKILERTTVDPTQCLPGTDAPLAELLLAPTRIYVRSVLSVLVQFSVGQQPIHALAHITGGGLTENIPRVLPETLAARISMAAWPRPPVFTWLQQAGNVMESEMRRTFNCGIGMVVCVAAGQADMVAALLTAAGEQVHVIGTIVPREGEAVVYEDGA